MHLYNFWLAPSIRSFSHSGEARRSIRYFLTFLIADLLADLAATFFAQIWIGQPTFQCFSFRLTVRRERNVSEQRLTLLLPSRRRQKVRLEQLVREVLRSGFAGNVIGCWIGRKSAESFPGGLGAADDGREDRRKEDENRPQHVLRAFNLFF